MDSATIPADVAWIRDVVLPLPYRRAITTADQYLTICPCQGGPSGTCARGRHEQCVRTLGWHRHGEPSPETYIASRSNWHALTPVWRAGRACRWLCPCRCHAEVHALFAAPPRVPGRASRTGGNNRIGSTDRIRGWDDDPQLDLFDIGAMAPAFTRPAPAAGPISTEETTGP